MASTVLTPLPGRRSPLTPSPELPAEVLLGRDFCWALSPLVSDFSKLELRHFSYADLAGETLTLHRAPTHGDI